MFKIVKAILLSPRCDDGKKGTQRYKIRQWLIKRLDFSQEEEKEDDIDNVDDGKETKEDNENSSDDSIFANVDCFNKRLQTAQEIDDEVQRIADT